MEIAGIFKMFMAFWCLFLVRDVLGIRMVRVEIPTVVLMDDPVWLNCSYDLEGDELYAIKWYKNDVEFYRYLPSESPTKQQYPLLGIFLDPDKSVEGNVNLYKTNLSSEGIYRCEVSAEAPTFQTVRDEKTLHIHVLPSENPKIQGVENDYKVGDTVNVTCASGPAKPPPKLKWFINGIEASSDIQSRTVTVSYPDNLQSSLKKLSFVAEPSHFQYGYLNIRCSAIFSQTHAMVSEEIVIGERTSNVGQLVLGYRSDGPTISGGKSTYELGDRVNVNCTSSPTKPAAELQWLINQKPAPAEYLLRFPASRYSDGHEASIMALRFTVGPQHFYRGKMRLKCTATLSQVIATMASEQIVRGNFHQSPGLLVSQAHSSLSVSVNGGAAHGVLLTVLVLVRTFYG